MQVEPRFKLGGIEDIIDPKMKEDYDEELYTRMTDLAIRCSSSRRAERPTMKVSRGSNLTRQPVSTQYIFMAE